MLPPTAFHRSSVVLSCVQFRQHLDHFIAAYNFGRRLKTLKGLTPYEFICKQWTKEPERLRGNPIHQMPELNILAREAKPVGVAQPPAQTAE